MLRYFTSTLTACALAGTVIVLAQDPAPAQPEKQQAPKETLTGCVMEAKTTDGGKAYMLNNDEGAIGEDVRARRVIAIRVRDQRQQEAGSHGAGAAAKCHRQRKTGPRPIRRYCVRRPCRSNP